MAVHRNCESMTRRDCLRLGLGGFFGLGLVDALRLRARAGLTGPSAGRPTSCILIWMDGGPTHYETFDPKPEAPVEIRGDYTTIATQVPGVRFSSHMTRLAGIADRLSIVRSIRHDQGNHGAGNHYMMTGAPPRIPVGCGAFVSFHPSLGSVVAHERGASTSGLPSYFSIPQMSRSGGPNFLGAKYAPFVVPDNPNREGFRVRDVALPGGLNDAQFTHRRDLRSKVDRLRRITEAAAADPVPALDEYYRQGYDLIGSKEAQAAFDMGREPEALRDLYGRTPTGQRCLLARRLVEAGVPFVTVYEGGWDSHFFLFRELKKKLPPFDQAVAALIRDLDQRGLLETTLVVAMGEFGRTPKVNKDGGRDHWSNAMSVLLAGCGTPGGQVVGATDSRGYTAVERILGPENLASTIYTKLGIDPGKILYAPNGRPAHIVSDPTPIAELMG